MINNVYLAIPKECRVWCCGLSESISGQTLKMQRAEIQEAIALIHYLQRQKVNKDSMSLHILKFRNQSKGGVAARTLSSHQCAPVQIPASTPCMWVQFVVGSLPCHEGFSPGTPVFPSPQKLAFPNSNSTRNQVDKEAQCGCATFKSLFIYLLRGYLIIFVFSMSFQLETFVIFF